MWRTTALELAPCNILVNTVCPGSIRTAMLPDDHPEVKLTEALCPLARIGEVDEVTGLYQFLASAASAHIAGQAINVDGGVSAGIGMACLGWGSRSCPDGREGLLKNKFTTDRLCNYFTWRG